jgi:DNA-binding XRE family transcriptional regulator
MTVGQNTDGAQPGARSICLPARPLVFVLDGQRLRQLRRQHGLSQQDLADQAGISLTTVARLERQPRTPCRGRTLARLAAVLGEHPATTTLHPSAD